MLEKQIAVLMVGMFLAARDATGDRNGRNDKKNHPLQKRDCQLYGHQI